MFNQTFYHDTIRKYVILFGTIFNDVYVQKTEDGEVIRNYKVPISYGPKEKFLVRLQQDPNLNKPFAIQLPRMAFEMTRMSYAAERKLPTLNKISVVDPADPNKLLYQYTPTPYDFNFTLHIMVKRADDGTRILEQILPYFTPDWTPTMNLDSTMKHKYDIPIILNNVNMVDTYEGNFIERRALTWTLDFTLKGYVFGPTMSSGQIKRSIINMYNVGTDGAMSSAVANTPIYDTITTIPVVTGKTLSEIEADDDYAFSQTITQLYE
jgi:hypothetical protein